MRILVGLLALAAVLLAVPDGEAVHFDGGTMFAEPESPGSTAIEYDITTVWTLSKFAALCPCNPGDTVDMMPGASSYFRMSDPPVPDTTWDQNDGVFRLFIIETRPADNLFVAKLVMADGSPITYDYAGGIREDFEPKFDNFARRAVGHANNPDTPASMGIRQVTGSQCPQPTCLIVPKIQHPVIVECGWEVVCQWDMEASISSGEDLAWRFSTTREANWGANPPRFVQPGPPFSSVGVQMSPDGHVIWDTKGTPDPVVNGPTYYSMHASVDVIGRTASSNVDFLVKIVPSIQLTVECVAPTPGGEQTLAPGETFDANVAAISNDDVFPVFLEPAYVPPGTVMTVDSPGQPATATVSFTPPKDGQYLFSFTARVEGDNYHRPASNACSWAVRAPSALRADVEANVVDDKDDLVLFQLLDASEKPSYLDTIAWSWSMDGKWFSDEQHPTRWLSPGWYYACLTLSGTSGAQSYEDTACIDLAVVARVHDEDRDGVADQADNCPADKNRQQLDADHDGIGDACDSDTPDGMAKNPKVASDRDGDGVLDDDDPCPDTPNELPGDQDRDGIPDDCDLDLDGDGFDQAADQDNCPLRPNPDQLDSDGDGVGDACQRAESPSRATPEDASPMLLRDDQVRSSSAGSKLMVVGASLALALLGVALLVVVAARKIRR